MKEGEKLTQTDMDKDWTWNTDNPDCGNVDPQRQIRDSEWMVEDWTG
jgi:hypothetical protein